MYRDQSSIDSLAYIDHEYEIPQVKEAVHSLIAAEMRTFTPSNYLGHLPYPELKFVNSSSLKSEYNKIVANGSVYTKLSSFDMSRYNANKPHATLESDFQAWKTSLSNAKAQYEHQENRLINLELMCENGSTIWLETNELIDGYTKSLQVKNDITKRKIDEINSSRQSEQNILGKEIRKLTNRRDDATSKLTQLDHVCTFLEESLLARGIHIEGEYNKMQKIGK